MRYSAISLSSIAMLILLAGCASTEDQAARALEDTGQVRPNSNYQDVAQYPGNVTCGKYLTTDYQGFPIYKDFVVLDTVANLRPLPMDVKIYCSDDPAAALNTELGIDYEVQKSQIDHILDDFRELAVPLEAYINDNPSYPWTEFLTNYKPSELMEYRAAQEKTPISSTFICPTSNTSTRFRRSGPAQDNYRGNALGSINRTTALYTKVTGNPYLK